MSFRKPVDNATVTRRFGENPDYYKQFGQIGHNGVDLAVPAGTPVYAMDEGTVSFEGWGQNHSWMGVPAGICVLINHVGSYGGYAHMTDTVVNKGQHVNKGDLIGHSGQTGAATGPHVHSEMLPLVPNFKNGYAGRIDIWPYFDTTNTTAPAAGGNQDMTPNFIKRTYYMVANAAPTQAEIDFHMAKSSPESFINGFGNTPLWLTLQNQVTSLSDLLTKAQGNDSTDANTIADLTQQLAKAKSDLAAFQANTSADTAETNKFKAALKTVWQFVVQVVGAK